MPELADPEAVAIVAALDEAIRSAGSVAALASGIKVSTSSPSMWKARGRVPPEHAPSIERFTRERHAEDPTRPVVICERLAPWVDWEILRLQSADVPEALPHPLRRATDADQPAAVGQGA